MTTFGKTVSLAVVLAFSLQVEAFEIEQVFRETRHTRGNVNRFPMQPIDDAAWLWCEGVGVAKGDYTPFVRFRTDFSAVVGEPLHFDVSADARFVLLLDGEIIARGPHKGVVNHWYYESYVVRGLSTGEHRLEAVVFDPGERGALSILTSGQNGFILKAEGAYDTALTTGKAKWVAAEVRSVRYGKPTDPDTLAGAETISTGTGFLDAIPAPKEWKPAIVARASVKSFGEASEYGFRADRWALFPTERPDPVSSRCTAGSIRAVKPLVLGTNLVYTAESAKSRQVAGLQRLLENGEPYVVPPHSSFSFLWDLDDYYCAYPEMEVSNGSGARVRWSWAESLYGTEITGHIYLNKGNRNEFIGKRVLRSMDDTFLCDGRPLAKFTTPWWRAGRWVEISIETADEPIELRRLAILESRYPLEPEMRFECDDPTLAAVQRICVRGMQNCLHEMFMDCPYFEQQMYPGDTRIEMLVLNAISGDDRPSRFGMGVFDYARRDDGQVPMNFPCRNVQDSSTYSMCWAMMAGDYVRWHGTNDWLRARIPGLRHTLSVLANCENDEGLVAGLPGWNFVDWVPEWDNYGNAPDGRCGLSALNNLLYVAALKSVAETETAVGDLAMAAYWRAKAERTGQAIVRCFWSEKRGMIADTCAKDVFSEHTQCLALLLGVLSEERAEATFKGLVNETDLARATVYFSHYLFETYIKFGRADLLMKRLGLWREYVRIGLKTPMEAPGWRGRSDCHAWGAHPLYHLVTGVAGVSPDAFGYSAVRIAPHPGGLRWIKATCPTPKGVVRLDLKFDDGRVSGSVELPKGLPGTFEWSGRTVVLQAGINKVGL